MRNRDFRAAGRAASLAAAALLAASGCSSEQDNRLPDQGGQALEERVGDLERETSAASAERRREEQGAQLTQQTLGETNSYLAKLYANINGARPQDLPEWQEMHAALTDEAALGPDFALGPRGLRTNFHKLQVQADAGKAAVQDLRTALTDNAAGDTAQKAALEVVLARLATIDQNIKELNTAVDAKFAAVDKTLADYEGRITGVENRMRTTEIALDAFRGEFVEYRQRVKNIESLLQRYDLATMHGDIASLKEITQNHEERLLDLASRTQLNASDIAATRADLADAERELSDTTSRVGTLKVSVDSIQGRLDRCGCPTVAVDQ